MNYSIVVDSDPEALVEYSQRHPWRPHHSPHLVRRFLTELISGPHLIFDLHDAQGRLASAVLLDKISNPSQDAGLEILGMRDESIVTLALRDFLRLAIKNLPSAFRGLQISLPVEFPDGVLREFGFLPHYDTYEMFADLHAVAGEVAPGIQRATREDREEIYRVVSQAFAENLETSVPDAETWSMNFLKSTRSHFFTWKSGGQILGFANLVEGDDDTAEVHTLGVLAHARGRGVGASLLKRCLAQAVACGAKRAHLTVAAANEGALGIYLRAGFATRATYRCYRRPRVAGDGNL